MRLTSIATAVALLGPGAAAAQQFEGVVTIRSVNLTSDIVAGQTGEEELSERGREKLFAMTLDQLVAVSGAEHPNVMQVKGSRMRTAPFDMPGLGSTYMLFDVATGMMRTVAPSKRGYYEASLRGGSEGADEEEASHVEPLGRTQMISGLRCTGYRVTQGDQVMHVWTTDDAAAKAVLTNQLRMAGEESAATQRSRAMLARYGAPVMTQTFDEEGNYSVEVWSFERKPLPDSLFVVPAGFTKLRSPGN
jgi:uncharacterized protein DUF4412